jgi:hypothetical protein
MLEGLLWKLLLLILTAIPLHIAVKLLGGNSSIVKAMLVNIITGILTTTFRTQYGYLGIVLGFLFTLWIYREVFRLIWIKSFLVFIVQAFIILLGALFLILLGVLTGAAILTALLL